jgi:predicted ATPase
LVCARLRPADRPDWRATNFGMSGMFAVGAAKGRMPRPARRVDRVLSDREPILAANPATRREGGVGMRLVRVYVRFYKSFNYDYERKFANGATADPWEMIEDNWYPFVRLPLDSSVTTIVGANESGKSHLLDSIEKAITGKGIERSDFCRYSRFFSVREGQRRRPDFGLELEITSSEDAEHARQLGIEQPSLGSRFHLFRLNGGKPVIYGPSKPDSPIPVSSEANLEAALPVVFRLDARIPLPTSIPLYELTADARRPPSSRRTRWTVLDTIFGRAWTNQDEFSKTAGPKIFGSLGGPDANLDAATSKQTQLGRDLLFQVAGIASSTFQDLSTAIADEQEGYVNAIIAAVNSALAARLNFPRWWAQDREFRLQVSPREYDLVFTIRDRTETDYSFSERSHGLRYFLSYYVQLLAHRPPDDGRSQILLMDEPDAYLSSQGQQDLLRILEEHASPEDGSRADQVVYVTHSPFLINKNRGERIRVLDKGVTDEGTRVVRDAARNHYEPLRSALGAFVAETAFIGGANLFVEGLADQVMLAGMSSHLQSTGAPRTDTLDLNTVTIVPAGSASHVPYLVFLARGRHDIRPACVALLDSDKAGTDAAKVLAKTGGPRIKPVLPPKYILQIGQWADRAHPELAQDVVAHELEDLVPVSVAAAAARRYAIRVIGFSEDQAAPLTAEDIAGRLKLKPGSLFDAVKASFSACLGGMHIEKVGFAREVVGLSREHAADVSDDDLASLSRNFALLLADLAELLRGASTEELELRLNNRLNSAISGFLADYPTPTTRERGRLLLKEIVGAVEDAEIGDRIRLQCEAIKRDFSLDEDALSPIENFDEFRRRIQALRYEERFANQDSLATEADDRSDDVAQSREEINS